MIQVADALEQGRDLRLLSDVQSHALTSIRQCAQRRVEPLLSARGDDELADAVGTSSAARPGSALCPNRTLAR
jgi:hypothetical protein